jgi:tRNA pseudouridine38-40 synthase
VVNEAGVASEQTLRGDHAPETSSAPTSRRIRLQLAYDGAAFFGAQVQSAQRTVASELTTALDRITGQPVPITFAGRTDRGVHADGQVAHGDILSPLSDERLQRSLNAILPPDLVVSRLETVHETFHARYDARWREYRYQVWNAPFRHPALARQTWHLIRPLDCTALTAATNALVGEHDFAAFAGQGLGVPGRTQARSTVREVYEARWLERSPTLPEPSGQILEFWVRASGFLPQMVRTIVAAAIEVGTGRQTPEWFESILREGDRSAAPAPAPPQGLSLWRVGYELRDQPSAVCTILADSDTNGTAGGYAEH